MKDSQIGTYGVIALVMSLGLRWLALSALIATNSWAIAVISAAIASRGCMVWVMFAADNARASGLSCQTGCPPSVATWIALGLSAVALTLTMPSYVLHTLAVAGAATLTVFFIAKAKIGGQTGDVLGATQQVVEIALLLSFVALLP